MEHVRKTYEDVFHYSNNREINEEETDLLEIGSEMMVEDGEK